MPDQERKTVRREQKTDAATEANPAVAEKGKKLKKDLDELLDEIDSVLVSYRWEFRETETDRERASLLSAVGWCSGWAAGLAHLD